MNIVFISRQRGAVILEALIAFLILGVGVVAMLYLQGDLMSSSNLSKARAEAMEIAKDRTEILRNYIEEGQYLAAISTAVKNDPPDIEKGVNATYAIATNLWLCENEPVSGTGETATSIKCINSIPTPPDDAELLSVPAKLKITVKWSGTEVNAEGNPIEEMVVLDTVLNYTKPEVAVAIVSEHNSGVPDSSNYPLPSPWVTGVEGSHESTKVIKEADPSGGTPATDKLALIVEVDSVTGAILTETEDIKIITYYDPVTGHSNVEVVHGWLDEAKTIPHVRLTSFGGIVHKLKGEIILHHDADTQLTQIINNFHLLASPPSYCVAPICADGECLIKSCTDDDVVSGSICNNVIPAEETIQYVSYVCYVPGDCTNQDEYVTQGGALEGCRAGFKPPQDKNLNGGWYGRIGNFNLFLDKEKDMVCTADAPDNLTPSREYVTHRWELDVDGTTQFIAGNEGINRPFDCDPDYDPDDSSSIPNNLAFSQVFIISEKVPQSTACIENAAEYIAGASSLFLPPENVIRIIGENTAIPTSLSPIPYLHQPLDDLLPYTVINVVQETHDEHCVLAP